MYIICVVYVKYMQSIQYHVFWYILAYLYNVDSMQQNIFIFVDLKIKINLQKYIGHDVCNLVIEILFIIIGYIELLVINVMFLSK